MMNVDKISAWRKFSETGAVSDYIEFKNFMNGSAEAKKNENEYRRSGAQGDGHRRK